LADASTRRDDARKRVAEGKSCDPTRLILAKP
ncbi:integrase, partial [Salmonella enterica subsp. enterica serovar Heidelberg]